MLDLQLFLGRPLMVAPLPESAEADSARTAIVVGSVPRSLLDDCVEEVTKRTAENVDLVCFVERHADSATRLSLSVSP